MRLSFNYTDRNTDRRRPVAPVSIYSGHIDKKSRGKLKTSFVLKYFVLTCEYKPGMNLSASILVKITMKQEIY